MPKVTIQVSYSAKEFRDIVLTKIPTRGDETLADVFDMLVKSLVETAGLTEEEAQAFAAPGFMDSLKNMGLFGVKPEPPRQG
jgi:hypothetical protein